MKCKQQRHKTAYGSDKQAEGDVAGLI